MTGFNARPLTELELETLKLVSQGKSDKMVAKVQKVAPGTIADRMRNIYFKLHACNRTEAVAIAYQQGILPA